MTAAALPRPLASERTLASISRIVAVTTLVIAGFAAVLSFESLRLLAVEQGGVNPRLAWMWPLILDGTLVVASGLTLYATLRGQRPAYPWLLVLGFTGLSIAANIAHGEPTPVGWGIAGLPPLALALTWHLLLHLKQEEIIRREQAAEAARLAEERAAEKQRRAEERARTADRPPTARPSTRPSAPTHSPTPTPLTEGTAGTGLHVVPAATETGSTERARPKVSPDLLAQARAIVAAEPRITGAELGARFGKSDTTGRNILAALRAETAAGSAAATA